SHNPVEWQGIKFSPHIGIPAPTSVTDFIAGRALRWRLRGIRRASPTLDARIKYFDPKAAYCRWIVGERLPTVVNKRAIRTYFDGKRVVIDEMHGTSRGYLREIFDRLGVPYSVLHGA